MSFQQLESLVDLRPKHGRSRYKQTIAIAALLTGTAILSVLFIGGFFRSQALLIDPPGGVWERSLAVRPDYQVSNLLYERRSFRWFLGAAAQFTIGAFAVYGLAAACTGASLGIGAIPCLAGAVGVVGVIYGLIPAPSSGAVTTNDLELGDMSDVDYVQNGSKNKKRAPGKREDDMTDYIPEIMRKALGPDYQLHGYIPVDDVRNAHLVNANEGRPVAVSRFTSDAGVSFHHAVVYSKEKSGFYHRLGFDASKTSNTVTKRQTAGQVAETSAEYFTSGGLDAFDCAVSASGSDLLDSNDAANMTSMIECIFPNWVNATQMSLQVYDSDSQDTIGAGLMAPFDGNGTSVISSDSGTGDCPTALPSTDSCGNDTSTG